MYTVKLMPLKYTTPTTKLLPVVRFPGPIEKLAARLESY